MANWTRLIHNFLLSAVGTAAVVFVLAHVWLCWALSVIVDDRFLSLCAGFFPILASAGFTVVLLVALFFSLLKQAAELSVVGADVFDKLAGWMLHGATVVSGRDVELKALLKSIDISVFRNWGAFWSGIAKVGGGVWLALGSLALFRYQTAQYNPLIIVLLAGVFTSLLFRKWGIAVAFCVVLGGYFLLVDKAVDRIEVPDVEVKLPKISAPMPAVAAQQVTIVGGATGWVTAYKDLPFTNRFDVQYVSGNIRIATQTGDIVDHRGLLQNNGVPFDIRTARHLLDAGVNPSDWLVSDEGARPFSLVGCVTEGVEPPRDEDGFTVAGQVLVRKGQSLHLWYNHLVRGRYRDNHRNDRGQYVVLLRPAQSGLPE